MDYYVYILSNRLHTVLYTGVTNNLLRRLAEHKAHIDPDSFTAKYKVDRLVYYEHAEDVRSAIEREKQIKGWNRKRKNKLVESRNPQWQDLAEALLNQKGTDCHTSLRTGSQ